MAASSTGSAQTSAQTQLLAEIRAQLTRAVASQCPASMHTHREDIVQLAMLRVAKVLETRSEGDGPLPSSYLWRVAYTTTIDELRKMRGREQTRDRASEAGVAQPGAALAPDAAAEASELGVAIRACVGALSQSRRRAVSLYLQGHSVPDSGALLGWARKKTENLVFRGLADLRRCLESKGFRP